MYIACTHIARRYIAHRYITRRYVARRYTTHMHIARSLVVYRHIDLFFVVPFPGRLLKSSNPRYPQESPNPQPNHTRRTSRRACRPYSILARSPDTGVHWPRSRVHVSKGSCICDWRLWWGDCGEQMSSSRVRK